MEVLIEGVLLHVVTIIPRRLLSPVLVLLLDGRTEPAPAFSPYGILCGVESSSGVVYSCRGVLSNVVPAPPGSLCLFLHHQDPCVPASPGHSVCFVRFG